jgi:hypothetical protein
MKAKTQALLAVVLILAAVGIAQPTLASTTGGSGFDRWVLLESGDIDCNMSVPQVMTNETAFSFRGSCLNAGTSNTQVNVHVTINGTAAYSGAVTATGNNTTTSVTVTFPADTLTQGDDQWINVSLLVGDNVTVDDYWNGTINITTNIAFMVDYMIHIMTVMVMLVIMIAIVGVVTRSISRTMK